MTPPPDPNKPTEKVDLEELARLTARSSPPPVPMRSLVSWLPSWAHGEWMSNVQVLAAGCHVLIAFGTLIIAAYLGGSPLLLVQLSIALVVFGLVKEFGYDAHFELPPQTFLMNLEDFLGYCAGIGLAWGIVLVHSLL